MVDKTDWNVSEPVAPTQSVLHERFEDDDDLIHVAKAQKLGRGEGETAECLVSYSQSGKIAEENNDRLMQVMGVLLSGSMECSRTKISGFMEKF